MDILETILAVCLVALPIICVAVVPSFLKNWKRLILWHLIFSILANSLLLWSEFDLALHGGNPAGAGGVAILVLILVTFHLIACASMGLKIVGHINTAFDHKLFNVSKAEIEPKIHPDSTTYNVRVETMASIYRGFHCYSLANCLKTGINVTKPTQPCIL